MNASGNDLPPEWSAEVAAVWRDGEQFVYPEEWKDALDILVAWRAEFGIQEFVESDPIIVDSELFASCSDVAKVTNGEYAETIAILTGMNEVDNYYPHLD